MDKIQARTDPILEWQYRLERTGGWVDFEPNWRRHVTVPSLSQHGFQFPVMHDIPGFRTTCANPKSLLNCDVAPPGLPHYGELLCMEWTEARPRRPGSLRGRASARP